MIDTTQMTVARMITREKPPRFLVWVTRAGYTAVIEVQAQSGADAKLQACKEMEAFEAHRQHQSVAGNYRRCR